MATSRRSQDVGVVLHRRPYRETSLIVDCLTERHGRIGLVAKGARRGGRRSRLEPLREYALSWTGAGELHTLSSAEPQRGVTLQGEAAICALYVNELLMRLLARDDPQPRVYALYWACLDRLSDATDREPALRGFEYRLLEALGYAFSLQVDANGAAVQLDQAYRLDAQDGLVHAEPGEQAISGATLRALETDRWETHQARTEARYLMRMALAPYLGTRPLESPRLLKRLRQMESGGG